MTMDWWLSHRADPRARVVADRHYNRQKPGTPQFVPPGRCLVLLTEEADALWVTSWPFAEYVHHAWAGAWVNSLFRNESGRLSSDLIRQVVAATLWRWGPPPPLGIVTFVDPDKVRRKRDPGRCYRKAGFQPAECPRHAPSGVFNPSCPACHSMTAGGLVALQMAQEAMPAPEPAIGVQMALFA